MTSNDPRSLLALSPMSALQILVCTITVFLNALDGFDLLAISFATAGIMKEFRLDPSVGLGVVVTAVAVPVDPVGVDLDPDQGIHRGLGGPEGVQGGGV